MTQFLEDREIEHELADRHADARVTLSRLENAERKILDWKMRIRRNVDERFEKVRHVLKV
jgi:hypothetical protein